MIIYLSNFFCKFNTVDFKLCPPDSARQTKRPMAKDKTKTVLIMSKLCLGPSGRMPICTDLTLHQEISYNLIIWDKEGLHSR